MNYIALNNLNINYILLSIINTNNYITQYLINIIYLIHIIQLKVIII